MMMMMKMKIISELSMMLMELSETITRSQTRLMISKYMAKSLLEPVVLISPLMKAITQRLKEALARKVESEIKTQTRRMSSNQW